MTDRERDIIDKCSASDNPLLLAVIEHAEFIAQEVLADKIYLNGVQIYG